MEVQKEEGLDRKGKMRWKWKIGNESGRGGEWS